MAMEPSAQEVRTMLRRIDVEGWEGPSGRHLLEVARTGPVRAAVRRTGLTGPAAAQAEASAWAAAWDALQRPTARIADSPLALATVAAQRAVWAELAAARPGEPHGITVVSLDVELASGRDIVAGSQAGSAGSPDITGRALGALQDALVAAGWSGPILREAIELLADHVQRGRRQRARVPWRWVALRLGLPEWRVRRLAVLVLGREHMPGLLALVAGQGADVLDAAAARDAIATTCRQWMPSPEAYLAELASGPGAWRTAS
jgi:hypothetical protein